VPILLAGCENVQSVLAPHGPRALQIAQLAWILFAVGLLVLLVVTAALWLAISGTPEIRTRLAGPAAVVLGGIVFPAVTLTALLGFDLWLTHAGLRAAGGSTAHRIEVVGEQWWWRVAYLGADGNRVMSANEIRIPVGRDVEFTLKSADVIHSFWVPSLGGKVDMIPGRTTRLRVSADRAGVFRGQCAEYCGGPHALMAITVIAMPVDDYEAWQAQEAEPAAEPTTGAGQRGRDLFLSAGCGACHTVRGIDAIGTIGPDLTHVGSRRSIGADTLAMTPANVARFIVDNQHIKPGNKMPPFRIFLPDELDAVATYLVGLR
jgi:cytochrome c oxidase subunit 2